MATSAATAEKNATGANGLTASENALLAKLLGKVNASNVHAPAVQVGEPYRALVNLSVPRRGEGAKDKEGVPQCDLVPAGEIVYLTEEEAARFNRHNPNRDGRRIEVVVKVSEEHADTPQRVHPSYLSGPLFRPVVIPGDTGPRPDPAGSSQIIEYASPVVPESSPVQPGSENAGDAIDIPPAGSAAAAAIRSNVDMDIVNAAKAALGKQG